MFGFPYQIDTTHEDAVEYLPMPMELWDRVIDMKAPYTNQDGIDIDWRITGKLKAKAIEDARVHETVLKGRGQSTSECPVPRVGQLFTARTTVWSPMHDDRVQRIFRVTEVKKDKKYTMIAAMVNVRTFEEGDTETFTLAYSRKERRYGWHMDKAPGELCIHWGAVYDSEVD